MKVCMLMLNQMHQIQDVINTPCVATYNKSEVKKNKFFDHQDVVIYQMEHQPAYASDCWDSLLVPILSHTPLWSCFLNGKYGFQMSAGSLRRKAKHQWRTRGMSTQISFMYVSWF